jgi:hypothetical protein
MRMPVQLFFPGQSLKHLGTRVSTRPLLLLANHIFRDNVLYANELGVWSVRVVDHTLMKIIRKVGAVVVGLDMTAVVVSSMNA